jgi:regulator of sigma E protease
MSWFLGIILVLGVMILVHEWGHFVMARIFKVRVDVFSIGFGPRLFGWKRGATDYRLSALPLGGYVRMAGQDLSEIDSGEKAPTGAPDELMSKPRWQRALISFAGPLVNLIFPVFLLTAFYATKGEPYPEYLDARLEVVGLSEKATPDVTPLRVGDRVIAIDNVQNPTWEQAERVLTEAPAGTGLSLELENKGGRRKAELKIPAKESDQLGLLLGYAPIAPIVDEATPGYPADKAGVKKGDRILNVNGQPITLWGQFVDRVRSSNGSPVTLEVQRSGRTDAVHLTITPQKEPTPRGDWAWVIGVGPVENLHYKRMALSQAAAIASAKTYYTIAGTLDIVKKLLSGQVSIKQLQGPVGISGEAAKAVKRGSAWVVSLMVLISVNLGILNLLPIPILDGGNILLLAIEGGLRRDLSMTFKERYIQVGLVFLLVLFAIVMYHDVLRQIPSHS